MDGHLETSGHLRAMRRRGAVWLAALVLLGVVFRPAMGGTAVVRPHPSVAPAPLVFDGVTVVDVEQGRLVPDQRVVIVGNRIRTLGSMRTVKVPAGARVINARGKYLIPGLWDMHTHSRRLAPIFYPVFLANGVTGIRDANTPVPIDTVRLWQREILAGTRVGPPRQILSGPSLNGEVDNLCTRAKIHSCLIDSADARYVVDSLKAAGADIIKTYSLSRKLYFVVAAAARRAGIPFGGHTERETPIEASDSGASIVDHLGIYKSQNWVSSYCSTTDATLERCQQLAERFKHNGTWFVPTIVTYVGFQGEKFQYARPIHARYIESVIAFWTGSPLHGNWLRSSAGAGTPVASRPNSPGVMHLMQQVGLPIMAGTDTPLPIPNVELKDWSLCPKAGCTPAFLHAQAPLIGAGFSLHTELAMYVAEGMTPLTALQTATLNPAKFLHATDSLGTVAQGKLADLVLLDANPLADITNTTTIRAVVANGRYFDRAALDSVLVKAQASVK